MTGLNHGHRWIKKHVKMLIVNLHSKFTARLVQLMPGYGLCQKHANKDCLIHVA